MELFDTHFVYFCQVLLVSGLKTLVTSYRYIPVVKTSPYLDYFQTNYSKIKTNIRLWMYTPNGTVWYPFCLLWSNITCFRPENVSYELPILQVVKTPWYLDYFQTFRPCYSKMKTNIRLWMYTPNGIVWYPFCLLWSSITCFRPENVSYKFKVHSIELYACANAWPGKLKYED